MQFFKKVKKKLEKYPTYVKTRDKVAKGILTALLAFFDFVGPVWNFLFLKRPSFDKTSESTKKIRQNVIKSE